MVFIVPMHHNKPNITYLLVSVDTVILAEQLDEALGVLQY